MRVIIFLFLILFLGDTQAQIAEHFKQVAPRLIGPAGMSGRITAIAAHPTDENIIYVGAASGGVWKSQNRGVRWEPIFDEQPNQSIGAIALDPLNPSVVWVGTGEGNPRNSHNSGKGIYKSTDGGKTWTCMGLEATKTIHRIVIDPLQPNTIFVGSLGSIWGPNAERGVFKSTDGGHTWEKVLYVNNTSGCGELRMHPTNPNILLAAMWDYQREPYSFRSGGKGSGIYKSIDGGKTWKKLLKKGLPELPYGRIGLSFADSSPELVYALIESKEFALYKSTDSGDHWEKQSAHANIGNRPFYYAEIYVNPSNEHHLFSLWTNISESIDGGKSWSITSRFKPYAGLHPDHHALFIHPANPNFMLNGNDGGLNISDDGGKTWRFVENIPVGQFYHVSVDNSLPYRVGGGMQDNGSWVGPGYVWEQGGIKNHHWQEVYFGDGFDVQFTESPNTIFAMSQRGNIGRVDIETGRNVPVKPIVSDTVDLRFNWNAAVAKDPFNAKGIYFGSQFLHYSTDMGDSWKTISPDLTTNDKNKQKQDSSGGLTLDVTGAENYTTILAIAPHPKRAGEIWVATDDGNLQVTENQGKDWKNIASRLPGLPKNAWLPQVVHSTTQANELFVVANNYRQNDFNPYLYHSKDGGKTFRNIANQLPAFVLSVIQDIKEPNLIFCGTDEGLYYSINAGNSWTQWTEGFPSCPVADLQIHPETSDLIIGTFGRSIWVLDNIAYLRTLARDNAITKKPVAIFPPADAYMADIQSIKSLRFIADGTFVGANKPFGASFTLWVEPHTFSKDDKIKFLITNQAGDTIRHFTSPVDTGFIKKYWNFDKNGPELPKRKTDTKKKDSPSSLGTVEPGIYKVYVQYKATIDSTTLSVLADPRSETIDWKEYKQDLTKLSTLYSAASDMYGTLENVKKQIAFYKNRNMYLDATTKTEIDSLANEVTQTMDSLATLIAGPHPDSVKGYVRTDFTLNSKLQSAYSHVQKHKGFNSTGTIALNNAKRKAMEIKEAINNFLDNEWKVLSAKLRQEEKLPVAIPKIQFE